MPAGTSTRDELVSAGLALNDELPLDRLFAGVTTAAAAQRAGVTTGSFFHHFRNASEYAAAIARSYLRDRHLDTEVGLELVDAVRTDDLAQALSNVLVDTWQVVSQDPAMLAERRGQMHLFAHHRTPLDGGATGGTGAGGDDQDADGLETVGDVLRTTYRTQFDGITATWQQLLGITDMRLEEPFDAKRLAVAVYALILGLEIIHAVDPESVDDRLFADTTVTLTGAVSRLDLRPPRVVVADELGQDPADVSPQARSGARRRQESRLRIVAATTGMFDDGWDSVSATEVAEAAGVSTQTVINLFGNVRRVCAATFVRHLPGFESAIDVARDRPQEAVRGALLMLARSAADDPHPARAYLTERVGIRAERGWDLDDDDIRILVPFGIRLTYPLASATGRDIADASVPDLSSTLVDFVLGNAVPRPRRSEETVDLAMRLLPTGSDS